MKLKKDSHQGDLLQHEVINPLGITTTEFAERIDISVEYLSAVIEGRKPVDADLAQKLEGYGISTSRFWLAL